MRSPLVNRKLKKTSAVTARGTSFRRELPHTHVMDAEHRACKVVADHVLSIADESERATFTRQLIAYSIASLVVLEGEQVAAEFAYAAADATVGVS